jgi:hypothetical protein
MNNYLKCIIAQHLFRERRGFCYILKHYSRLDKILLLRPSHLWYARSVASLALRVILLQCIENGVFDSDYKVSTGIYCNKVSYCR